MSTPDRQLNLPGFERDAAPRTHTTRDDEKENASDGRCAPSCPQAVYAMDVHFLIFQVFHALPDIRSPAGQPVAAVHGFIQDVIRLVEREDATYVFCAFDTPLAENRRRQQYPLYKSNREEMPDDLRVQVSLVRRMLETMTVPMLESPGYEADDILATVARQAERRKMRCFLVTGDKDCRQLLSEHVSIFNIRKNEFFDAQSLERMWGIRPDQVVDFQALVGDAVDTLPGVPLIGPKTASQLLNQFGTLDSLLNRIEEVAGEKRRAHLKDARESVLFIRELMRLSDNVPTDIDWETCRMGKMSVRRIQPLCRELGLHRLADRCASL